MAGTALGRGWYDGTSFAGEKFERGRDLCHREPLSPGTSFAGNLFRRGFWQQGPLSPGVSYDGTSFAGDFGEGPLSPGMWEGDLFRRGFGHRDLFRRGFGYPFDALLNSHQDNVYNKESCTVGKE